MWISCEFVKKSREKLIIKGVESFWDLSTNSLAMNMLFCHHTQHHNKS